MEYKYIEVLNSYTFKFKDYYFSLKILPVCINLEYIKGDFLNGSRFVLCINYQSTKIKIDIDYEEEFLEFIHVFYGEFYGE